MRSTIVAAGALLAALLSIAPASAQNNWPTPGGSTADGKLEMCLNSSGQAVPWFNSAGTWQCSGSVPITGSLSLTGTTSNASSGVATSSTNLPTVSYNYGFNGATWDQLQVDASKFLKVNVAAGTVAATPGTGWPIGTVGAAVPTLAEMLGLNVGGTARGWSGLSTGAIFPAAVAIVDGSGAQITTFGTAWANTNKVEPWDGANTITVKAASTAPVATDTSQVVALNPNSPGIIALGPAAIASSVPVIPSSQYPGNATAAANPITASATGTTGATTATLAGVASKTTFICGFTITSDATAALAGTATLTGTVTGTMSYIQNVGGATAAGILSQTFTPCIPASATNTGIAVNSVAAGTGGNTAVTAWGYQL